MIDSSVGGCSFAGDDGTIGAKVLSAFIVLHLLLLIITNVILYKVRNVQDRYQEQKYVALASSYVVEVLLVGVPVLFAVQGNTSGVTFLILILMVFLTDFGILCLIFVPKIMFQMQGLPEGVPVTRTILREPTRTQPYLSGGHQFDASAPRSPSNTNQNSHNNSSSRLPNFENSSSRASNPFVNKGGQTREHEGLSQQERELAIDALIESDEQQTESSESGRDCK